MVLRQLLIHMEKKEISLPPCIVHRNQFQLNQELKRYNDEAAAEQ